MFHKLVDVYREYGLGVGLLYGIDRALQRLSSGLRLYVYQLMVQPIPEKPLLPARFARHLQIREIRRGDPEVALMPARPDIKEARFDQNAVCLGAFRDARFIGYMWFCYRQYQEDEVRCTYVVTPADQAIFDYDMYIFPEHRMGLAFAAIWSGAAEYLRARGIRFTFSRLTKFNLASERAHRQLGCKRIAQAFFLNAGPLQLMTATVRPYLHLSWSASSRVRLKLAPTVLHTK